MIFIHLIFLNLLTLVIITQFESLHKNPLNPENIFVDNVNYFKKAWAKFSDNTDKIPRTKLIEFFRFLGPPLGVNRTDDFFIAASKVMKMEIRSDLAGFINFHSALHATMKNFFYEKLGLENAKEQILKRLEIHEKNFFSSLTRKSRGKNRILKLKARLTYREKEVTYVKINPFNDYLTLLMCFLSWRKYSYIRNETSPSLRPPPSKEFRNFLLINSRHFSRSYKDLKLQRQSNGTDKRLFISTQRANLNSCESFLRKLHPLDWNQPLI